MYLAAIADSQPQPPPMPGQVHNYFSEYLISIRNHFESLNMRHAGYILCAKYGNDPISYMTFS